MRRLLTQAGSWRRGAFALLAAMFLSAAAVGTLHHHDLGKDCSDSCAICKLSHARVTTPAPADLDAPPSLVERVVPRPLALPGAASPVRASSRSPPSR
jgi:hypothetical protein